MDNWKLVNIKSLKLNEKNPRTIKDSRFDELVKSIQDFPKMLELRPIVVNAQGIVLGGNMRLKAALKANLKKVPVIYAKDLTEAQQREFIIKDNVGFGDWDWPEIIEQWPEAPEWGLEIPDFPSNGEVKEDDYEIPDEIQTDIKPGDLFEIGNHRLLCGDSTKGEDVGKLIGKEKWQLLLTSPPYNQGNGTGDLLTNGKKAVRLYDNESADNMTAIDYYKFIIDTLTTSYLFRDESDHTISWNVSYNAKSRNDYGKIIFSKDNPFDVKETIVWDKGHSINLPQVGIYSRRCEFVFIMSTNERYRSSQVYNDCRWNYWDISSNNSQKTGGTEHRAAFPVAFAGNSINDFSFKNDCVYDPFIGSGTTMVAAHQLNRKCYGMEIDPKYCQVTIDRMKKLDPKIEIKKNGVIYTETEIEQ